MPRIFTSPAPAGAARLARESRASRPTSRPSSEASLAPALPPSFRAIASSASSRRSVFRARAETSGSRSQKILRSHEAPSQKNLRARTTMLTATPCQGRSETVRS